MQSKVPDITPYLPWFGMAALALWKIWEQIKQGKKAVTDKQAEDTGKALAPVERRAKDAEALLALSDKRNAITEAEKLRAEAEVERLKAKLAERDEIEDKLQTSMNSLQGRMDALARDVDRLMDERGKDESSRRGR